MALFSAQELLRRHGIEYINTRSGSYTTNCNHCNGKGYLNVKIEKDRVAWYCHFCDEGGAERFEQSDGKSDGLGPITAVYDYTDEQGELLFQALRFEPLHGPKQFRQRKDPDQKPWSVKGVRIVPFRLPDLLAEIANENVIFVVEGEKDVLTLRKHGIPATCNPMGAGKWWPEFNTILANCDVVIIGDNDEPGRNHVALVASNLLPVAARVRVLDLAAVWPGIGESDDVSDWFDHGGGTVEELWRWVEQLPNYSPVQDQTSSKGNGHDQQAHTARPQHDQAISEPVPLEAAFPFEENEIPVRDWCVPGLLLRRHVTVLVAPSGSGKSLLTLQLGLSCCVNKPWANWRPRKQFRVFVINSEDDVWEQKRRLAAAVHVMEYNQHDLAPQFFLVPDVEGILIAKFNSKTKTLVRTPQMQGLIETIQRNAIDVVIVDPFAETFEGDENSNSELKWAGIYWREVARRTNCAVLLVHHTKKYATGMAGDVDAARGASALIGIARIVATLFPMTSAEAELMGVPDEQLVDYLRYDDAKANLNRKSPFARWFHKRTIILNNATDELPADEVGALEPWSPQGLMDNITEEDIDRFFVKLDDGVLDKNGAHTGDFFTFKEERGDDLTRWAGKLLMVEFKITEKAQAKKILKDWMSSGRIVEAPKYYSKRQRKWRSCIHSSKWTPPEQPENVLPFPPPDKK